MTSRDGVGSLLIYKLIDTTFYCEIATKQVHGLYTGSCTMPRKIPVSFMLYYIVCNENEVAKAWRVQDVGAFAFATRYGCDILCFAVSRSAKICSKVLILSIQEGLTR
jgi:hypothetical protein